MSWDSTLPAFAFHQLVCLLLQVAPTAAAAMWSSSSLVSPAAPEQHGVDETSSTGRGLRLRLILGGKDVALEVLLGSWRRLRWAASLSLPGVLSAMERKNSASDAGP